MTDLSPNSTIETKFLLGRPNTNTIGTILLFMSGSYVNANPPLDISKVFSEKYFIEANRSINKISLEHMGSINPTSKSNLNSYKFRDFLNDFDVDTLLEMASKQVVLNKLNSSFSSIDSHNLIDQKRTENLFHQLSTLPIEDSIIELSNDSLLLKLKLSKNLILLLNTPLTNLNEDMPEIVYTLFEDKEIIASNYASLDNITTGVNEYINA